MHKDMEVDEIYKKISLIKNINIPIVIELASLKKNFEFLLNLKEGDIIDLEKNIEDFVNIYFLNEKVGFGELVNVNEKYGVRLVDLIK
ncbi:MAG TPA: flagellar motor switch protein FliN [Sulfurihydrogenibium sp.]|uniref:FliM/FliN family flagellar motor switch protein n=1 Tax=Sulfurihydrogenibium sp. (strain YO3AOP1) TaxID=436114 RepID=UPI0001726737|nr:FliM/FliN family flagellar motor switch protein [Sulfurihydrogenibium sp. YO3AOP1]ACD67234.1 surface presentation of antigens (SPOA) protein [Sulfurihydrogenibium sp. YO3AOP1]HBT98317.1 flagellar motor switch protein FliN [Sulfurihydrogenibium sp.]